MRSHIGALAAAIGLAFACQESLPSEEVPLDGHWYSEYRTDTSSWAWFFERHGDGQTYGGFHSRGGVISWTVAIDTAWLNYPGIRIRMVMDSSGNCWPGGVIGGCTLTGRFLSRNTIEIRGKQYRR